MTEDNLRDPMKPVRYRTEYSECPKSSCCQIKSAQWALTIVLEPDSYALIMKKVLAWQLFYNLFFLKFFHTDCTFSLQCHLQLLCLHLILLWLCEAASWYKIGLMLNRNLSEILLLNFWKILRLPGRSRQTQDHLFISNSMRRYRWWDQ